MISPAQGSWPRLHTVLAMITCLRSYQKVAGSPYNKHVTYYRMSWRAGHYCHSQGSPRGEMLTTPATTPCTAASDIIRATIQVSISLITSIPCDQGVSTSRYHHSPDLGFWGAKLSPKQMVGTNSFRNQYNNMTITHEYHPWHYCRKPVQTEWYTLTSARDLVSLGKVMDKVLGNGIRPWGEGSLHWEGSRRDSAGMKWHRGVPCCPLSQE